MMSSIRFALAALAVAAFLSALLYGAPNPNPPTTVLVQDAPPADSITAVAEGMGVKAASDKKLGFQLDEERYEVYYGFNVIVTRSNDTAMKKSIIRQDMFLLSRLTFNKDGAISHIFFVHDKENEYGAEIKKDAWEKIKKEWDKDGAVALLRLDHGPQGKIDGNPAAVMKKYDASKLEMGDKQFIYTDLPGFEALILEDLVGVDMYRSFGVTSTLEGGKTVAAVPIKVVVEVEKNGKNWKKKSAGTDPKLPKTWTAGK